MRNGGEWTESRFQSFVKSALRSASQKWPPKYKTLSKAFVGRRTNPATGREAKFFKCNRCGEEFTSSNIEVNHIEPVIPVTGFDSWDKVIERLFCEEEGLEALCRPCHKIITKNENAERKLNAKRKK